MTELVEFKFSEEGASFVRAFIDDIFLADENKTYCCTTPHNIEVHHADGECCLARFGIGSCGDFHTSPQYLEFGQNSKFAKRAHAHHMTACVVSILDMSWLIIRHYDEDADVIKQWDRLIPKELKQELIENAKMLELNYRLSAVHPVKSVTA